MSKPRLWWVDLAQYVILRTVETILVAMPPKLALSLARFLAWVAFIGNRRHRNVAIDNLRQAYPGRYTDAQLNEMVLQVYQHFAKILLEMTFLRRMARVPRWWEELARRSEPLYRPYRNTGRPLLLVTAHYGNWELGAFQLLAAGIPAHIVARPLDNPYLDASVLQFREAYGHKMLSKQTDLWMMYEVLRTNGTIVTMADQDAGPRGLFVEFFGRPASTHKVMAILAQRTDALIGVISNRDNGELFDYEPLILDVIDVRDYPPGPESVRAITQRMTTAIEHLVRTDPVQYLWLHRRWKHQPQDQAAARAA